MPRKDGIAAVHAGAFRQLLLDGQDVVGRAIGEFVQTGHQLDLCLRRNGVDVHTGFLHERLERFIPDRRFDKGVFVLILRTEGVLMKEFEEEPDEEIVGISLAHVFAAYLGELPGHEMIPQAGNELIQLFFSRDTQSAFVSFRSFRNLLFTSTLTALVKTPRGHSA